MKSKEILEKYIKETFASDVEIKNKTSLTAEIEFCDGTINLLALHNTITVYIDGDYYQTLELVDGNFQLVEFASV